MSASPPRIRLRAEVRRSHLGKHLRPLAGAGPVAALCVAALLTACAGGPGPGRLPGERKMLRRPPPFALPLPVDGVRPSELRDSFGDPRSGGRRHEGIDIFAPRHTPVRSTTDGVVERRREQRLGGYTVSILGPGGQRHYYAHLERWARLKRGRKVKAGQIIGWVGNSGNARRGPTHLHYAIYLPSGRAMNPYPLLLAGPGPFPAATSPSGYR